MSSWDLQIPFRDRADPVIAIADAARALADDQEQAIARCLALELVTTTDIETVGEALDAVEAADAASRRALLDRARERAGLASTAKAEAIERFEAANRTVGRGPARDSSGEIEAICSAPGCQRFEPHPNFPGLRARGRWRRWWCREHRPGNEADLEPHTPGSGIAIDPRTGVLVDPDERAREGERARAEAERRQERWERRLAERRAQAPEHERRKRAEREQLRRESPRGLAP
jgi:hypothetical protein